jgi:uncharacterized protein (DUF1800 family)
MPKPLSFLVSGALLGLCLGTVASAALDQDGDGMSDLWQQMYPAAVAGRDSDGDGISDEDEAVAGTDPLDRASRLELADFGVTPGGGAAFFRWQGLAGKLYRVDRREASDGTWSVAGERVVVDSGPQELEIASPGSSGIFRLRVSDLDQDGDGLSAWEEGMLGFSDASATSSGQTARSDYAVAFRMLEGIGELALPGGPVIAKRSTRRGEAARFLVQASFGADGPLIDAVAAHGIGPWLDAQFAAPATSTYSMMISHGQGYDAYWWRKGWWRSVMLGEDQLRQRMAYALSQILVINCDNGSVIGDNPLLQGSYYDLLGTRAFGNYRDVLEKVTYSAQMGSYLSHLRNRKSDPALNRFPDENFAREIMQLFTIGLWELHPDGTRKLDAAGDAIPTYDNAVITEMAKVFTGLSFSVNSGYPNASFFTGGRGNDYLGPMMMFDEEHEPGEKHIIGGVTLPAGQSGDEDIEDTLDALCGHPNIGPFLSRLLIQRFTSSNPSPDYIRRVASVWNDNGTGIRGDLKAVTEAILLDPEARTPEARGDASGKVREPLLRVVGLLRAFKARNASNTFPITSHDMVEPFGQFPLLAPSVFNFYSPDHRPLGELRNRGLVAPELEIATTSRLLLTDNRLRSAIDSGFSSLELDLSGAVALAGDTDGLLDHLDGLLTWGRMSPATRATVRGAVAVQPTPLEKVRTAVHLMVESPDYAVLK